jgi:hypothetical protein
VDFRQLRVESRELKENVEGRMQNEERGEHPSVQAPEKDQISMEQSGRAGDSSLPERVKFSFYRGRKFGSFAGE